MNLTSI